MMSSSVSSVLEPQSVPSRISVVLVEEAEVWGAECLASVPVDKALRLLAGAACPVSVTVCEHCIMMPGVVGTLSRVSLTLFALLAMLGRCPRLTLTLLARVGRCPHLTLTLLALLACVGRCPRLTLTAMWALMGRCPHPTLPEYCLWPFLLGYRSQ